MHIHSVTPTCTTAGIRSSNSKEISKNVPLRDLLRLTKSGLTVAQAADAMGGFLGEDFGDHEADSMAAKGKPIAKELSATRFQAAVRETTDVESVVREVRVVYVYSAIHTPTYTRTRMHACWRA
jgi:hypothetical protein